MKKFVSILVVCAILAGCSARPEKLENAEPISSVNSSVSDETVSANAGESSSTVVESSDDETASGSTEEVSSTVSSVEEDTSTSSDDASSATEPVEEDTSSNSEETSSSNDDTSTSTPVVEAPAWTEEPMDAEYYVNTQGIYSREEAVLGSAKVKLYNLNDKVSVVASTNTSYYKLEDGSFIHKDYLSSKKVEEKPQEQTKPDTSTSSSAEQLLNAAKLNPMKTNDADLDSAVESILNQVTTANMSTYQKVKAVYDYIINTYTYGPPDPWYMTHVNYHTQYDASAVSQAYALIDWGVGVCDNYSALFFVMTRALGLETYRVSGQVSSRNGGTTGHAWTVIKLNGKYYIFDPQVEQSNLSNGKIQYLFFCKEESTMSSMYTYDSSYAPSVRESLFGNFVVDEGEFEGFTWTVVEW